MDRGREKRVALHGRWRSLPGSGDCSAEQSQPLASKNQNSKTKKRKNRRTAEPGKNRQQEPGTVCVFPGFARIKPVSASREPGNTQTGSCERIDPAFGSFGLRL